MTERTGEGAAACEERVRRLLLATPGRTFTTRDIASELGLSRRSVCVYVRALRQDGRVQSSSQGRRGLVAVYWAGHS